MYLESIKTEYKRYKKVTEGAVMQVKDSDLTKVLGSEENSISITMCHIAGNLKSRFTDFLTSDGEKPWRKRDQEFIQKDFNREELLKFWEEGWTVLFNTLDTLEEDDLGITVQIRGYDWIVIDAINRSISHIAYHVGQIVLLARIFVGYEWKYLSVPKGMTEEYNKNPTIEKEPKMPQ